MDKIELIDESGKIEEFQVIDTFGMDDNDYAVLMPVGDHDDTTMILRIEYGADGELVLVSIEDDNEFEDVVEVYEELKNEKLQ